MAIPILSSVGSFFGRMFGTEKALNTVVSSVSSGLDKLYYSDEEKADDASKSRSEARVMVIEWMRHSQGQNIARRSIACMVVAVWLFQYVASGILNISAFWVATITATKLSASASVLSASAERMNGAVMLILAFYFAAPHMGKIVSGAMDKFAGKK